MNENMSSRLKTKKIRVKKEHDNFGKKNGKMIDFILKKSMQYIITYKGFFVTF
jgi:hypothetical protein